MVDNGGEPPTLSSLFTHRKQVSKSHTIRLANFIGSPYQASGSANISCYKVLTILRPWAWQKANVLFTLFGFKTSLLISYLENQEVDT